MIYIDSKYARRLKLDQCKETRTNFFNFRCPLCGDSKKSLSKKRGWLMPHKKRNTILQFYCHNCQETMKFSYFLKKINHHLWIEYTRELLIEGKNFTKARKLEPEKKKNFFIVPEVKISLSSISQLGPDHVAYKYLLERKISKTLFETIYYTENYKYWINKSFVTKYNRISEPDERIVFPLHNISDKIVGFQGRAIDPGVKVRYLTVKLDESEKVLYYGLNKVDRTKEIFITEGIFDSLMLDNSIALLKTDYNKEFLLQHFSPNTLTFIFDNEKRNKQIRRCFRRLSQQKEFWLFIYPNSIYTKDLNDIVIYGMPKTKLRKLILENRYYGVLRKGIELAEWLN